MTVAEELAGWAASFAPAPADLELARGALVDTTAVALAARDDPFAPLGAQLGEGGRLASLAHLLDYDDLHLPSTSHISAVCVPAALAAGGDARAHLAGAGVMARLGEMLGWRHYSAGWHATCTAGAPAAAAAAATARGLDAAGIATAMALAVPAAGGVQRAFGTTAKPLQVGFAVDAGLRGAALAGAGATADPAALDAWLALVGGTPAAVESEPAVLGGLAVKVYPCCYALQRPIEAARAALGGRTIEPGEIAAIAVAGPAGTLQPLIHHRPATGLEGKFSLEYALAAVILDGRPGLGSFGDDAVARPEARALVERVAVEAAPGGDDLLSGAVGVRITLTGGEELAASVEVPAGAPGRPLPADELRAKVRDCAGADADTVAALTWDSAAHALSTLL